MLQRILRDFDTPDGLGSVALRYFNAPGADPKAHIGERHNPETHLIPLSLQAALGVRPPLKVFGRDYDTPEGTCIRDYVYVDDLASAHSLELEYLWEGGTSGVFNLGNGAGFSIQQLLNSAERVIGKPASRSGCPEARRRSSTAGSRLHRCPRSFGMATKI